MNIHFKDKILFNSLKKATLAKVRVGSHLYGNNNENSDEDFLYIYATSENELKSFVWTNHQLQYKEEGIDHNFVSLHTFVRNIINGDSTINFEVVHSNELIGTPIEFLHKMRNAFNTYTVIKSYNGFGRRDCKHFNKAITDQEKRKCLGHIIRGYWYAERLLDKDFDFTEVNKDFIIEHDNAVLSLTEEYSMLDTIKDFAILFDGQRKQLNSIFEDKASGLAKLINVDDAIELERHMSTLQFTSEYRIKQASLVNFDMNLFINVFENWVTYE